MQSRKRGAQEHTDLGRRIWTATGQYSRSQDRKVKEGVRGSSKHLDSVKEATEGSGEQGCGWHCAVLEEGMGDRPAGGGKGSQTQSRLPAQAAAPIPLLTALGTCPSLALDLMQDLVRECPFGGNSRGRKEGRITAPACHRCEMSWLHLASWKTLLPPAIVISILRQDPNER